MKKGYIQLTHELVEQENKDPSLKERIFVLTFM